MSSLGEPWEMIIADDGSTDTTVELVEDLGLVNLRLLKADRNVGKGSAVRRGVLASQGEIVLFADADQSTPIEQFERLAGVLRDGYDVVVGSRAAEGADVANKSFARKLFSTGLNLIVRGAFRIPVADTQCGFKMFTAEAAEQLFRRGLVDEFSFDLEVLYLARKFGLRTAEVPVNWIDAPGSKVNPGKVAIEFLRDLSKIRWNDFRGRYDRDNHRSDRPARQIDANANANANTQAG